MTPALLIYDGSCGFCTQAVTRLRAAMPRFPRAVPSQSIDFGALGLTQTDVDLYVWLIDDERSQKWRGADAFGALLAGQQASIARVAGNVLLSPVGRMLAAPAYRMLAKHRHRLPGGTAACELPTSVEW